MSTATQVLTWEAQCREAQMSVAEMRGFIAAMLVVEGHCPSHTEALRYVRVAFP